MPSPHDALFKWVLGDPEDAASMLRTALPERVSGRVDWATLKAIPIAFVDEELAERYADLLFEARIGGQAALIYFLFEHQSSVDPWMPLRLLDYSVRAWNEWRRKHPKAKRLPAIVPFVLHHSAAGWKRSTQFSDLLDLDRGLKRDLAPYLIDFKFVLDDLTRQSDERLSNRAMTTLTQALALALKHLPYSEEPNVVVERLIPLLARIVDTPRGRDAIAVFLRYFYAASDVTIEDLRTSVRRHMGPLAEETVMSTADKLIQQGEARGEARGKALGEALGEARGRASTLLKLLHLKFGPQPQQVVDRVTNASIDELDRWAERILNATSTAETLDA